MVQSFRNKLQKKFGKLLFEIRNTVSLEKLSSKVGNTTFIHEQRL